MLRVIQIHKFAEIVKSSNNRTGQTNFYGVREKGATNKPFTGTFNTLRDAREFCGAGYNPPVKETMSESDCAAIQAKKAKGKNK